MSAKYAHADPQTGVNLYQVALIEADFAKFQSKFPNSAKSVCIHYALSNPGNLEFCPHLSGKTGKNVHQAVRTEPTALCTAQMFKEISHMAAVIQNLRNPDVVAAMSKLCKHPFDAAEHKRLNQAWMDALAEELGGSFDEAHQQAWHAFLHCPARG